MTTTTLQETPRSRPSSIRRAPRGKDKVINSTNSRSSSRSSSRPSSRPTSRPVSPTFINGDDNDPIIPTAIVIKNIPFSVKKDALLNKLSSMDIPTAYAFNYHFDNGVFRGLAFANYKTPEETEIVVNAVNGLEIGGRKLRVEYKKMLPDNNNNNDDNNKKKERELTPSSSLQQKIQSTDEDTLDLNDPEVLELYSYLLLFRGDPNNNEIAFPKSFSIQERKTVHLIADRLGLAHYSEGYGNDRQVIVEKRGTVPAPIVRLQTKGSRGSLRSSPSRERLNNSSNNNNNNNAENGKNGYRKSMMSTSTTAENLSAAAAAAAASNVIHPIRQPRGPEPGKNFVSRKSASIKQLANDLSRVILDSN